MAKDIDRLLKIVAKLRGNNGCLWDRAQTHQSLKSYLLEEAHEVIEAIEEENDEKLCEELGDLLLQIILHAQFAKEEKRFNIHDVVRIISQKMIRRHPHVFGKTKVENIDEIWHNWEKIKKREKEKKK